MGMDDETFSGKYSIIESVGKGGMAEVFLVENLVLKRKEALKVMLPEAAGDAQLAQRFLREAQALAQMKGPRIAEVYEYGQAEDGRPYIAMQYVEGRELKHLIEDEGMLRPERAVGIAVQVCEALEEAHSLGIIHKDVKPSNIMLDGSDNVKLIDFGIAQTGERAPGDRTTAIVGTPHYMSPEQLGGYAVEPPSDLYSLGVVLYEMCVGEVPFAGEPTARVIERQMHDIPADPIRRRPRIGNDLNEVIMRALAKDPADRFASAAEFKEALAGCSFSNEATPSSDLRSDENRTRRVNVEEITPITPIRPPVPPAPPDPVGQSGGGGKRLSRVAIAAVVAIAVAALICAVAIPNCSSGTSSSSGTSASSSFSASASDSVEVVDKWFGSVKKENGETLLNDLSGIEGKYKDERRGATSTHGYYESFRITDAKVDKDGKSGECRLKVRWLSETDEPIFNDVAVFDEKMSIEFDSSDMSTLTCVCDNKNADFWCEALLTKKGFKFVEGSMCPGRLSDPDHHVDLTRFLARE